MLTINKSLFFPIVILYFIFPIDLLCQKPQMDIPKEWIYKTVKFRDYLLRQNENSLYELRDLLNKWEENGLTEYEQSAATCLLYTSPSPRDRG